MDMTKVTHRKEDNILWAQRRRKFKIEHKIFEHDVVYNLHAFELKTLYQTLH